MLGRLSVALLLVASPVLANDPAPAGSAQSPAPAQEYKTKKVCRTVEVAGSFIPRTHCVTKKVPVARPAPETEDSANTQSSGADDAAKGQ